MGFDKVSIITKIAGVDLIPPGSRSRLWSKLEAKIQDAAGDKDNKFKLKGPWKEYIRAKDGFKQYRVDADWVRSNLSVMFGLGGHGLVHEFIPMDELWVAYKHTDGTKVGEDEFNSIISHEQVEFSNMDEGKRYLAAHRKAEKVENKLAKEAEGEPWPTGSKYLFALAATASVAALGAGAMRLVDKGKLERQALSFADRTLTSTATRLDDMALQSEKKTGMNPYVILGTSGPGVGVGPKSLPVFAGADLTGVNAGVIMPRDYLERALVAIKGKKDGMELAEQIPGRPFAALRLGPTLIPFEAGVAVGRGDAARAAELVRNVDAKVRARLNEPVFEKA